MNPEEFANLVQLYELNRAQQALNKQINQDQNLSENIEIRNFNFDETINSIFLKKIYKFNSNTHLTDYVAKNNNNFLNFLFKCKPTASCIVSSSTSLSTSTLISTNRDLLDVAKPQKQKLDLIQDKNELSSNHIQSKIMLKRRCVENNKYEDQFDKKVAKKLCQQHDRIEEGTDFQNLSTNSQQPNSIDNKDTEHHIQHQDDYEMDNNSDFTINNEISSQDLHKNRVQHNNNKMNLDLQQKDLYEVTLNFKNDLLSKCSLDLFSPIPLRTELQVSDKKLIQDDILQNIKNYDSYLECKDDQCQIRKLRDHFHCSYDSCVEKSFTKRDEVIRHIKWHKKRSESLNQGFLRFSSTDDCTQFKMQQQQNLCKNSTESSKESNWTLECQHNRKQTHYHCIQPNCDKMYLSTSDVQMHSNYHRKNTQLSLDGFQRFRANEKCNKDYCLFNQQHTTHFHCLRESCKFTFKNKSDVEKHKTYHNKDFELLKDGFKKFLKNDQCIYSKCRFSKVCNHIHCMRQDCNYVLHSSGQLLSHKRRHDRLDAESRFHHHNMLQYLQIENKQQNNLNFSTSTGLAEFPIDLSLINFDKMNESISGSKGSSFKLKINQDDMDYKYFTEDPESNIDLISKELKSNCPEKLGPANFVKHNNSLTKNLDSEKNLLDSSMLNSFLLNNPNFITNNNAQNYHKLRSKSETDKKLQPLNKSEIDLMINKYFTINYLENAITNTFSNQNDVECTLKPQTDEDHDIHDESNDEYNTVPRSNLSPLVSNQKYFHCKIINCNKIIRENLVEILDHIMFHKRQSEKSCKLLSESSEDITNLLHANSLATEKNLVQVQNENLKDRIAGAECSMQITSIDGLFNRKRGRPPKNRFVEVYLNNEKHQSPQAVFTSFKLAKHKDISSLETNSDQFKCFNLVSTKKQIFDAYEKEILLETTPKKKKYDNTDEANKINTGTATTDGNTILKTLKTQLNNVTRITDLEEEVSSTSSNIESNNLKNDFDLELDSNLVLKDDTTVRTKEKLVKTLRTFYPQSSISSQEISKGSSSIYLKQYTKRTCKLNKKQNKYCRSCNLKFDDIEDSKAHICCDSISNSTDSSVCTTANERRSILGPSPNNLKAESHNNEQPVDLSLTRVTDEKKNYIIENLLPQFFPPVVQNLHLAQNLAYLTIQKAIKENFEHHYLLAMNAAINETANPSPTTNLNSNIPDIFPDFQQASSTNILEIDEKTDQTEIKSDPKPKVILPGNISDQTIYEFSKQSDSNFKALKEEVIPVGYLKFRYNEDCQFSNCSYRNHQTHFHCGRIDCYYSFCDKTRFVQHTARHERLDKLMGDDFKQYRANIKCSYKDCEHYKNCTNQMKKSSHFHCLKCNFICSDTNKVVAHRRQHNKTELIELAGFRKISNNEKCFIKFQHNELNLQKIDILPNIARKEECAYSLKQTHYHCTVCDCAVLSKVQFNFHKHTNAD